VDEVRFKETAVQYTYKDYEKFDDDKRYELIDGAIYLMSPAPTLKHQKISHELSRQLGNFLLDKSCDIYAAPVDVCLNAAGDDDRTVVQPDIIVVCDASKLDGKRCNGAPDMVIEILSPSSVSRDMLVKFNKYLMAGVREYWIVNPENKTVHVCVLKDSKYEITDFIDDAVIPVNIFDGCVIDMSRVF